MSNMDENWVSHEDAITHPGVTKDSIRNWIKKMDIPAYQIGKAMEIQKIRIG